MKSNVFKKSLQVFGISFLLGLGIIFGCFVSAVLLAFIIYQIRPVDNSYPGGLLGAYFLGMFAMSFLDTFIILPILSIFLYKKIILKRKFLKESLQRPENKKTFFYIHTIGLIIPNLPLIGVCISVIGVFLSLAVQIFTYGPVRY
jgi:hypothetical protein